MGRVYNDVSKFWAEPPVLTTALTGQRYGPIVRLVNGLIPFGRTVCPEILSARTVEILRSLGMTEPGEGGARQLRHLQPWLVTLL